MADAVLIGGAIIAAAIAAVLLTVRSCSVLDITGRLSTGARTLSPRGAAKGKALVVYDVGLSGSARKKATGIADDLHSRGYAVTLAGVRSAAARADGYDVGVAGGPIYSGIVSRSIQSYLSRLTVPARVRVGAFARGGAGNVKANPFPGAGALTAVLVEAKPVPNDQGRASFVDRLLYE